MSIEVTKNWNGVSAEYAATENMRGVLFVQPTFYHVIVDEDVTTEEGAILAFNHSEIPRVYDLHPKNPWAFVKSKRADAIGAKLFLVTVNYDSIENPISELPQISWTFSRTTEPIDKDVYGNPITNSAGDQPDPCVTEEFEDLVFRMVANWEIYDALIAARYMGKINSDSFMGMFPPGTCKIKEFSAEERKAGPFWYYTVTIEIHIRWDGWKKRFQDMGTRELVGTKEVTDDDGNTRIIPRRVAITETMDDEDDVERALPVTEPVALDGLGKQLTEGAPAVYLEYQTKEALPYSVLGIG